MIEKLKHIFWGVLVLAVVGCCTACSDDAEELDEWTGVTYVYLKGKTLTRDFTQDVTVMVSDGVVNPVVFTNAFRVCLNKASNADVTVALNAEIVGGSAAEVLEDSFVLSADKVTIPAGQLESEEIVFAVDPEFLGVVDVRGAYDPTICTATIGEIVSSDQTLRRSTKTNNMVLKLNKTVVPYLNYVKGTPENSKLMDRAGWSGSILCDKVTGDFGKMIDGKTNSYTEFYAFPCDVNIDLGAVVPVLGMKIDYYSSSYCASQVEILISEDNLTWAEMGQMDTGAAATLNLAFRKSPSARYIVFRMNKPARNNEADIKELNVYVAE